MPFTISHAAAVLPFSRLLARWRLLSAAVIGSMVPDFGWFMPWPWRPARFETHSADALLTFCLPVGLAAYWLFQLVIRAPVLELLPTAAYLRWRGSSTPADYKSLKQWILAACGVLVGAITHLVWDAFTHERARGLKILPSLESSAVEFNGHRLGGLRLLQDASSLIGLIIVIGIVLYGLRPGRPSGPLPRRRLERNERAIWLALFALTATGLSFLFFVLRHHTQIPGLVVPLSSAAIATLRGLAAAVLLIAIALDVRLRRHPRGVPVVLERADQPIE
jgi:Domain of unknown function (DUF4184)